MHLTLATLAGLLALSSHFGAHGRAIPELPSGYIPGSNIDKTVSVEKRVTPPPPSVPIPKPPTPPVVRPPGQRPPGNGQRPPPGNNGEGPATSILGTETEIGGMGIAPGTKERAAFDKFSKWFDSNSAHTLNKPWAFFTGLGEDATAPGGKQLVQKFTSLFNGGKWAPDKKPPAQELTTLGQAFPVADLPIQLGDAPPGTEKFWYDALASYASARVAAERGGTVHLLMPKASLLTPTNKYFTKFEAFALTSPQSKVTEILRYDSDSLDSETAVPPVVAWSRARGDSQIGEKPNFAPAAAEGGDLEDDELIDLDMRRS